MKSRDENQAIATFLEMGKIFSLPLVNPSQCPDPKRLKEFYTSPDKAKHKDIFLHISDCPRCSGAYLQMEELASEKKMAENHARRDESVFNIPIYQSYLLSGRMAAAEDDDRPLKPEEWKKFLLSEIEVNIPQQNIYEERLKFAKNLKAVFSRHADILYLDLLFVSMEDIRAYLKKIRIGRYEFEGGQIQEDGSVCLGKIQDYTLADFKNVQIELT